MTHRNRCVDFDSKSTTFCFYFLCVDTLKQAQRDLLVSLCWVRARWRKKNARGRCAAIACDASACLFARVRTVGSVGPPLCTPFPSPFPSPLSSFLFPLSPFLFPLSSGGVPWHASAVRKHKELGPCLTSFVKAPAKFGKRWSIRRSLFPDPSA